MNHTSPARVHVASHGDAYLPYRNLAIRVIDQALRDLAGPTYSLHDRESAREFLAGSPMLRLWCAVAKVDPRSLVVHLRKVSGSGGPLAGAGGCVK